MPTQEGIGGIFEDFKSSHKVHSYIRSHFSKNGSTMIWKCANPLCTHTLNVPKRDRSMIIGRASLCPQCENEIFVLTSDHAKLKRPICIHCKTGQAPEIQKGKEIVADLFKSMGGTEE